MLAKLVNNMKLIFSTHFQVGKEWICVHATRVWPIDGVRHPSFEGSITTYCGSTLSKWLKNPGRNRFITVLIKSKMNIDAHLGYENWIENRRKNGRELIPC